MKKADKARVAKVTFALLGGFRPGVKIRVMDPRKTFLHKECWIRQIVISSSSQRKGKGAVYIPYKRVLIPQSRRPRRRYKTKMAPTMKSCVTEVLILKLKPQAEATAALLGEKFRIKRINDPLVKTAFTHTEHIGFVDHRLENQWEAEKRLWDSAVEKCERLNGGRLSDHLREYFLFRPDDDQSF